MKPSWDYAPEWAQWLAQDADGAWYWYEREPSRRKRSFMPTKNSSCGCASIIEIDGRENWLSTLECRPN